MSVRSIPLWAGAYPTTFLLRQWTQRGALQPMRLIPYLERDRTASPGLRTLWSLAFPTRQPLPQGPLSDENGRGTAEFWDALT